MMFEVEDLNEASPATVSRCGMIYMEPQSLGKDILIQNYLAFLDEIYITEYKVLFKKLSENFIFGAIDFMRTNCVEII